MQTYFINGFGTLPDVIGFHWLPKRPLPPPDARRCLNELAEIDARADAISPDAAAPRGEPPAPSHAAAYRQAAASRPATAGAKARHAKRASWKR